MISAFTFNKKPEVTPSFFRTHTSKSRQQHYDNTNETEITDEMDASGLLSKSTVESKCIYQI